MNIYPIFIFDENEFRSVPKSTKRMMHGSIFEYDSFKSHQSISYFYVIIFPIYVITGLSVYVVLMIKRVLGDIIDLESYQQSE